MTHAEDKNDAHTDNNEAENQMPRTPSSKCYVAPKEKRLLGLLRALAISCVMQAAKQQDSANNDNSHLRESHEPGLSFANQASLIRASIIRERTRSGLACARQRGACRPRYQPPKRRCSSPRGGGGPSCFSRWSVRRWVSWASFCRRSSSEASRRRRRSLTVSSNWRRSRARSSHSWLSCRFMASSSATAAVVLLSPVIKPLRSSVEVVRDVSSSPVCTDASMPSGSGGYTRNSSAGSIRHSPVCSSRLAEILPACMARRMVGLLLPTRWAASSSDSDVPVLIVVSFPCAYHYIASECRCNG